MKRLAEYTVFSGFVTAWRLAIVPTSTSPLSSQATTDGVSREPSSLTMTFESLPSMTATTLLVVPRSIPMILPMTNAPSAVRKARGAEPSPNLSRAALPANRRPPQDNHRDPSVNGSADREIRRSHERDRNDARTG